jgi:hypothetical protein
MQFEIAGLEPFPDALTGKADRSGIADLEKPKVFTADEFIKAVTDAKKERETSGDTKPQILRQPLTEAFWKHPLLKFFNAGPESPFRPNHRRFQGYVADDGVKFAHPKDVYREYEAHDEGRTNNLGTLRMWDFTKCEDGRFQSEEGRLEIARREQEVYQWLRDRDPDVESSLLPPKLHDSEQSVSYWEIYDRRRRMRRLSDFASTEGGSLRPSQRIDLARQLLAAVVVFTARMPRTSIWLAIASGWNLRRPSGSLTCWRRGTRRPVRSATRGFSSFQASDSPKKYLE